MNEYVVMDEYLDVNEEKLVPLITDYFFRMVSLPFEMDVIWHEAGTRRVWIVPSSTGDKKGRIINGYYQLDPVSLNPSEQRIHCRIVSCRDEITAFWFELAQHIRVSLLLPSFPAEVLTTPLSKQIILGSDNKQLSYAPVNLSKPWEIIPDEFSRNIVELWWSGKTNSEIGQKVFILEKSVTKKLWKLRKDYGEEVVPYKKNIRLSKKFN